MEKLKVLVILFLLTLYTPFKVRGDSTVTCLLKIKKVEGTTWQLISNTDVDINLIDEGLDISCKLGKPVMALFMSLVPSNLAVEWDSSTTGSIELTDNDGMNIKVQSGVKIMGNIIHKSNVIPLDLGKVDGLEINDVWNNFRVAKPTVFRPYVGGFIIGSGRTEQIIDLINSWENRRVIKG